MGANWPRATIFWPGGGRTFGWQDGVKVDFGCRRAGVGSMGSPLKRRVRPDVHVQKSARYRKKCLAWLARTSRIFCRVAGIAARRTSTDRASMSHHVRGVNASQGCCWASTTGVALTTGASAGIACWVCSPTSDWDMTSEDEVRKQYFIRCYTYLRRNILSGLDSYVVRFVL